MKTLITLLERLISVSSNFSGEKQNSIHVSVADLGGGGGGVSGSFIEPPKSEQLTSKTCKS